MQIILPRPCGPLGAGASDEQDRVFTLMSGVEIPRILVFPAPLHKNSYNNNNNSYNNNLLRVYKLPSYIPGT